MTAMTELPQPLLNCLCHIWPADKIIESHKKLGEACYQRAVLRVVAAASFTMSGLATYYLRRNNFFRCTVFVVCWGAFLTSLLLSLHGHQLIQQALRCRFLALDSLENLVLSCQQSILQEVNRQLGESPGPADDNAAKLIVKDAVDQIFKSPDQNGVPLAKNTFYNFTAATKALALQCDYPEQTTLLNCYKDIHNLLYRLRRGYEPDGKEPRPYFERAQDDKTFRAFFHPVPVVNT